MTREQLNEEKKRVEAELAANAAQRKLIKKRLAAVETLLDEASQP